MDKKLLENIKARLSKAVGYGIWLLIVLLSVSVARNASKVARIKADVEKEEARLEAMKRENQELEAQILGTQGPDFIEKQVRNKLGLVKEGEAVVILPDEETLRKLAPKGRGEEELLPDPNWKRWLNLFI